MEATEERTEKEKVQEIVEAACEAEIGEYDRQRIEAACLCSDAKASAAEKLEREAGSLTFDDGFVQGYMQGYRVGYDRAEDDVRREAAENMR